MERNSRRSFLKDAGAAVIVMPASERTPHDASRRAPYSFFTADEAAFIEPAVARLIPADETGLGRSKPSRRLRRGCGPYHVNKQAIRS
jgi:gluconate 2-dehydrogenase gamma chain